MLETVRTITYRVADPGRSADAVERHFGYQRISDATVSEQLISGWNTPAVSGRRCIILQPTSDQKFFLRFVAGDPVDGYAPLRTFGWNAAELLVDDVNGLAEELDQSAFRIIGGPRDLMNNGAAIALQVTGPADELFYLTQISGKPMQTAYGKADCPVDRLFIVVLGARDHAATLDFYRELGAGITRPRKFAIRVLAAAHGLDSEHEFGIAGACFSQQYRIEVDAYPASATTRPVADGDLPPGLSIASFTLPSLDDCALVKSTFDGPAEAPYFGARCAMLIGPSGEWIELIENTEA